MKNQSKNSLDKSTASNSSNHRGRSRLFRILKLGSVSLSVVIFTLLVVNWIWILSGSNEWELKIDKEGTQVYTLKAPGSSVIMVKGITYSDEFTLSNHLAPFIDESIQNNCDEWVAGCISYEIIKPWDPKSQSNVTMWTIALFPPFSPREFLLQGQLSQDPQTKVVTLENIAVPSRLPLNDCCLRLNHVHNVWHYTPVGDGKIKIEYLNNLEMGGVFPDFLLNLGMPSEVFKMLTKDNPKLLRQEKYRNAKLDFIDEGKDVTSPTK